MDFQDSSLGGHLGISIRTILSFFDLQVDLILTTKFQVNRPFGSGGDAQNIFQDGRRVLNF